MLKANKVALAAVLTSLLLSACESNDVSEEFRIAEIKPIANEIELDVVWSDSSVSGVSDYFSTLQPATNGKLIFAASREGELIAYDAETGKEVWESDIREPAPTWWSTLTMENIPSARVSGGLTYAYGHIYLGTEEGEVFAVSEKDGSVVWKTEVTGEVVSAPAAGEGWIAVSTTAGGLIALHPDTGEKRWEAETDVPALTMRGTSSPTIANGGVLVGTATGKLQVFLLDKGIPAWDTAIGVAKGSTELEQLIDSDSQPIVAGATIYSIAYNGNLAAVDMQSGRAIWKREYSSYRNIAFDFNTLYLTDAKGNLVSVDATSGVEKWSSSELYNRKLTQPVIFKNMVVVGDFEGYFHFFDKNSGELVARYQNDDFFEWFTFDEDGAYSAPIVVGDNIIVQTRDGDLAALRIP
jgi:outer membrane protein assembly factor BamB